jgi:hypothetical protein
MRAATGRYSPAPEAIRFGPLRAGANFDFHAKWSVDVKSPNWGEILTPDRGSRVPDLRQRPTTGLPALEQDLDLDRRAPAGHTQARGEGRCHGALATIRCSSARRESTDRALM